MSEKISSETIKKAAEGDRRAFEQIYAAYEGRLRSYVKSHVNDQSQVDDVLQNTFLAVHKNIGQLKDPSGLNSWIFSIAYNECMDVNDTVSREQKQYVSIGAVSSDDDDDGEAEIEDTDIELPEEFATNLELQKMLAREMNRLPQRQRDCLVLYYYKHKSIKEIAEMYSTSEAAVKNRKDKALANLRRRLGKHRSEYTYSVAPVGLLVFVLAESGKLKSAYLGTAIAHTAAASLAATAGAVVICAGTAGYIGFVNISDDPIDTDDSSIVVDESSLPDESSELDSEQNDESEPEPESLPDESAAENAIITDSTAENVTTGSEHTDSSEEDKGWTSIDLSNVTGVNSPDFANTLVEVAFFETEHAPIDENSREYCMLKMDKVEYKGEELRITYVPFLSDISNFTAYDPEFENSVPTIRMKPGLEEEYYVDGTLSINGDTVVMDFKGIKDASSIGSRIDIATANFIDKDIRQLIDSDSEGFYSNTSDYAFLDLFDVSLPSYTPCISNDNYIRDQYNDYGYLTNTEYVGTYCFILHSGNSIYLEDECGDLGGTANEILFDGVERITIKPDSEWYHIENDILYEYGIYDDMNSYIMIWVSPLRSKETLVLPNNLREDLGIEKIKRLTDTPIVLGSGSEEIYTDLLSTALLDTETGDEYYQSEENRQLRDSALNILSNLQNWEQYSKTGTIEGDIELMRNGEYDTYDAPADKNDEPVESLPEQSIDDSSDPEQIDEEDSGDQALQ